MSEAAELPNPLASSSDTRPAFGDPVVKSDTIAPTPVGPGGEPLPAEQATEPPKPEDKPAEEPEKKPRREDPRDARIRQLTAKLGDAGRGTEAKDRRIAELEAAVARFQAPPEGQPAQQPPPTTQADIERLIEQRAQAKVAERAAREETAAYNAACNRVAAAGEREYGAEFQGTVQSLWGMLDGEDTSRTLIEAALETDKPEAVLYHLGQNLDEAVRIAGLKPAKMGAAVAKIAANLATVAPKPAVSRAPAPIAPVSGAAPAESGQFGPKNMDDWIKWDAERSKKR